MVRCCAAADDGKRRGGDGQWVTCWRSGGDFMAATKKKAFLALGSAPTEKTLRERIHKIPGGTIFLGRHYVDLGEFDRVFRVRARLRASLEELEQYPRLKTRGEAVSYTWLTLPKHCPGSSCRKRSGARTAD